MPELPEVESVRRQLEPELVNRRVLKVWWDPHAAIPRQFMGLELLPGRRILAVGRRGKFMVAPLDEDLELIMHLGMTGAFRFDLEDPYVRARLELDNGRTLTFRDVRRFGRIAVVEAGEYQQIPTLKMLGPEPLSDDFDPDRFAATLRRTQAPIKPYLLSQRPVAGIGNIYADEALWLARINPRARSVGKARAHALHGAIREVLAAAIEREGTTFSNFRLVTGESGRNVDFLIAYGRSGTPCPRCRTPLKKVTLGGRGTTYCPRCQRR
ncbi:MAG: bifunctional DNA-formamidopyrimidine glycosylase/DNA-(apurinic or apyrimidinic site) lyase [Actinomycetota bacterium]